MEQIYLLLKNLQNVNVDVGLVFKENNIQLKISSMEDLQHIESLLDVGTVAAALLSQRKKFKDFKPKPLSKPGSCGLAKIIEDDLLFNFNWEGKVGKLRLKDYNLFACVLYSSWQIGDAVYSEKNFQKDMQNQIKSCKDRVHRRKRLQKDRLKVLELQEQLFTQNK